MERYGKEWNRVVAFYPVEAVHRRPCCFFRHGQRQDAESDKAKPLRCPSTETRQKVLTLSVRFTPCQNSGQFSKDPRPFSDRVFHHLAHHPNGMELDYAALRIKH